MRISATFFMLIFCTLPAAAQAGPAADACGELSAKLRSCESFSCAFERPLTNIGDETVMAGYQITGEDENGDCGYRVLLGEKEVMNCALSEQAVDTIATITEMQLDGSFDEKKQKLLEAVKTIDPETGKMTEDAKATLDPDFLNLNKSFADILSEECE